jgi:hypothetical protein
MEGSNYIIYAITVAVAVVLVILWLRSGKKRGRE